MIKSVKLQIRRQGKNTKVLEDCVVVVVVNYEEFLKKVIINEFHELEPTVLPDGTKEIEVGIAGDAGGGSNKFTIALMDRKDEKVKLHVILIYEAADTRMNNIKTLMIISEQIKAMNGRSISNHGKTFKIKQKGVFDLSAQYDLLGKQCS